LIGHSDLRRQAASRLALPCPSSLHDVCRINNFPRIPGGVGANVPCLDPQSSMPCYRVPIITNYSWPKSKICHRSLIQNIGINVCEKFHYDRLRNDRALGNGKSDNNNNNNNNNNNKNNVRGHWGPRFRVQKTMLFRPCRTGSVATSVAPAANSLNDCVDTL